MFETWRHLTNVPLTLGASLSATLMQNIDMQLTTNENVEEHAEIDKNEEEEVSIMQFNASLYLLTKEIATVRLRAMESTEYMIHRNIERSFKAVKDLEFEIGDRVICRNPEYRSFSQKPVARDPFRPVNIVATVIEVLPGSMYKVRCDDDAEVIEKALFKGEMVRFVEKEDAGAIADDSTMKKPATRMDVFNAISETGLQTRRFYYGDGSHVKFDTRSLHVQLQLIKDYETVLDCGALATLYSAFDKEMSDALRGMYVNGIFSLMEKSLLSFCMALFFGNENEEGY